MPDEEVSMETQMKDLKAAYRVAIGIPKKNKKGKNKKAANVPLELEDAHLTENNSVLSRADGQEKSQGSLVSLMERLSVRDDLTQNPEENILGNVGDSTEQPQVAQRATNAKVAEVAEQPVQPAARTTRRQAKAQEGPYDDLLEDMLDRQNDASDVGRSRECDYIMSLFAGRFTGPPRSLNNSTSGRSSKPGHAANGSLFLVEEALRKASRETSKETTDAQVPVESVLLVAEPSELKENVKDDQAIQESANSASKPAQTQTESGNDDSFVEQITSRSPAKPVSGRRDSLELRRRRTPQSPAKPAANPIEEEIAAKADDDDEDSFLEQITSRSPAKQVSRIEDSVEALDQMEEVEEALHEAAMAERMVSPEKTRQKPKEQPTKHSAVGNKAVSGSKTTKQPPVKSGYASMRVKPSAPKHTSIIKKATSMTFKPSESSEASSIRDEAQKSVPTTKTAPIKRPTSLLPPREPVKSTKPVTRPTNFELPGEAIARKLKEQRERRMAQRESSEDSFYTARQCSGPGVKSTKPLTKPSFELPGEALSRKKREAHEAKLKTQEEEERKRREFKAKPVRKSIISNIRDTVASRARQSKIGVESIVDGNSTISKRSSMNVGAHRPSIFELNSMVANTSAPRAPAPPAPLERKLSTKSHGPSMSGLAMQRTVSATEVQVQRQRAKEIYNRDQRLAEDIERERREREAAAKRSREEAAERGRQASREWAEKQRAKKLAESDKGMSVGYGPGGQMGLKA